MVLRTSVYWGPGTGWCCPQAPCGALQGWGRPEFLDMNEAMSTLLWDRPGTFSWIVRVAGYVFIPGMEVSIVSLNRGSAEVVCTMGEGAGIFSILESTWTMSGT